VEFTKANKIAAMGGPSLALILAVFAKSFPAITKAFTDLIIALAEAKARSSEEPTELKQLEEELVSVSSEGEAYNPSCPP
jgi:hypothetical protein